MSGIDPGVMCGGGWCLWPGGCVTEVQPIMQTAASGSTDASETVVCLFGGPLPGDAEGFVVFFCVCGGFVVPLLNPGPSYARKVS